MSVYVPLFVTKMETNCFAQPHNTTLFNPRIAAERKAGGRMYKLVFIDDKWLTILIEITICYGEEVHTGHITTQVNTVAAIEVVEAGQSDLVIAGAETYPLG